ncbi:hypothetical protein L917_21541, partial [Phytophthora nicotianae]
LQQPRDALELRRQLRSVAAARLQRGARPAAREGDGVLVRALVSHSKQARHGDSLRDPAFARPGVDRVRAALER